MVNAGDLTRYRNYYTDNVELGQLVTEHPGGERYRSHLFEDTGDRKRHGSRTVDDTADKPNAPSHVLTSTRWPPWRKRGLRGR